MNGRQRTISDFFWRDPELAALSVEDKGTLGYCLTNPSSNLIGVYMIVPRVCAAEMGWTAEQFLIVVNRLEHHDLVRYDSASGWLWVRIWWKHNQASMLFGPKLIGKTLTQIKAIPDLWKGLWIEEFSAVYPAISTLLDETGMPHPYPIDGTSNGPSENANGTPSSNVTKHISNVVNRSAPKAGELAASTLAGPGYQKYRQFADRHKSVSKGGKQ